MYGVAHVIRREPYDRQDLARASWAGSVLSVYRPYTAVVEHLTIMADTRSTADYLSDPYGLDRDLSPRGVKVVKGYARFCVRVCTSQEQKCQETAL